LSYHRADEAASLSGAAPVTVCTNDVALCHLVEDALPVPVPNAAADPEILVSKVVELEDERIGLTAVSAWVIAEVADQIGDAFDDDFPATACRGVDVLLFIRGVVLLLVSGTTLAAVVVALAS
jgi:hypothetical protein